MLGPEGNHAFMITSNDSIYSHVNVNGNGNSSYENGSHMEGRKPPNKKPPSFLPQDSSSISTLLEASSPNMASGDRYDAPLVGSTPFDRQRVSTASDVPLSTIHQRPPTDQSFWYDLYYKTIALHTSQRSSDASDTSPSGPSAVNKRPPNDQQFWFDLYNKSTAVHDRERELWQLERQALTTEINNMRKRLSIGSSRNDSAVSGLRSSRDDDKVYFDPKTVQEAQEKLRQLSVVSPHSSGRNTRNQSSSDDAGASGSRHSLAARLPSISEHVGMRGLSEVPAEEASPDTAEETATNTSPAFNSENPPSPPPTARPPLSPRPLNFTLHAGHTPIQPYNAHHSITNGVSDNRIESTSPPQLIPARHDGPDDEPPPLRYPRVLPTTPTDNPDTLDVLNAALQGVASNPRANRPQVMRDIESSSGSDEIEQNDEPPADYIVESGSNSHARAAEDEVGGVRLRSTRSMNFGAALGSLR